MIITRTPFRMSFFGGGTDFEDYFKEYGGAVLSTTRVPLAADTTADRLTAVIERGIAAQLAGARNGWMPWRYSMAWPSRIFTARCWS